MDDDELDPESDDSSSEKESDPNEVKEKYESGLWRWDNGELVRGSQASSSKAVEVEPEFDSYWKVQAMWDNLWPERSGADEDKSSTKPDDGYKLENHESWKE